MTTQLSAQVDKQLSQISNKVTPVGFISELILPTLQVRQSSGLVGKYGKNNLRIVSSITGGRNKYQMLDTRAYSTETYNIETYGLADMVTKEDKANVEDPFDAMIDATDDLTWNLLLNKEKGLADVLGDTGVITQNTTPSGTSQYSDYTNSTPLEDFNTARAAVYSSVGQAPDTCIMSWEVFNILRFHPAMLDALGFKESRPGGLRQDELASALDVRRVLIGQAVYNNSVEGQADNIAPVWDKNIIFCVAPQQGARRQVTLGYRFQQFGPSRVVQRREVFNPRGATEITVDDSYDQLLTEVNAAYLIKDAVA